MILAADPGGTLARLSLTRFQGDGWLRLLQSRLPGIDFSRFAGLPAAFLRPAKQAEGLCSLPVDVQLAAGLAREMH